MKCVLRLVDTSKCVCGRGVEGAILRSSRPPTPSWIWGGERGRGNGRAKGGKGIEGEKKRREKGEERRGKEI